MLKKRHYKLPTQYVLEQLPQFIAFREANPTRKVDELSAMVMYGRAINWLSCLEILWQPFDRENFCLQFVSHIVYNDPLNTHLPIEFFRQIGLSLEMFWTLQLENLYPEGLWWIEWEGWDYDIAIQATIERHQTLSANLELGKKGVIKGALRLPNLYALRDLPEFQEFQLYNPHNEIDESQTAIMFGRAIHWLAMLNILWPDFEQKNNYQVWVKYLVWNDPRKAELSQAFYQQLALTLKMFWALQLESLRSIEEWVIRIDGWEDEIVISAEIMERRG